MSVTERQERRSDWPVALAGGGAWMLVLLLAGFGGDGGWLGWSLAAPGIALLAWLVTWPWRWQA